MSAQNQPKARRGRYWVTSELRLLKEQYPTCGAHYVAQQLGRSVPAVRLKAIQLGVTHASRWQPEQDEYLAIHYGRTSRDAVARVLGRSVNAVNCRASFIGVTAPQRDGL